VKQSFTVQDLPVSERPRERLQALGAASLSGHELLALVLGRGARGGSVMMTAQLLLAEFGSLEGVVSASLEDLQKVKGLGVAKATQLMACLEIARRVIKSEDDFEIEQVRGRVIAAPDEVYKLLKGKIRNYKKEHFVVVSLDARDRVLGIDTVAVGSVTASLVHPRETFGAAIRRCAARIIVAHNHPSGDPEPSAADRKVTRRLVEAGKAVGIELCDHVIISKTNFFSFRDNQLF
jgi:DNA repair protein RadC